MTSWRGATVMEAEPGMQFGKAAGAISALTRKLSLKQKLIAIIMLACVTALLVAGTVFIAWEWTALRRSMVRDLTTHAEILADNCKAAVSFRDPTDTTSVLRTMEAIPSIMAACIYTSDGQLFATYVRKDVTVQVPPQAQLKEDHAFDDDSLVLTQPILVDNDMIGVVYLRENLSLMHARLRRSATVIASILLLAAVAAYLISSRLQRVISSPIVYLAGVANLVSQQKQYTVRAEPHGTDEVGMLIQAFNEMLEQIQQRDAALVEANEGLEMRVRDRTAELTAANESLTREIAFRKRAEQSLMERTERIINHQRALLRLAKDAGSDLPTMLKKAVEEAANTLGVERVGIWFLNSQSTELRCNELYTRTQGLCEKDMALKATDYPAYFQAIESSRIVAANDARTDPRTREFTQGYLEPAGITSMMDIPVRLHAKLLGAICCEHVGEPREWSLEEQDFGASIADMVALQVETNERRKLEEALAKANVELADTVRDLRRSNKELQEFAHVAAHDLKAPLRAIGTLADWIASDYADRFDETGRQQMRLLKGRVSRLAELIDGILHYSEIGKVGTRPEPVDLNELIAEIVALLDPPENVHLTVKNELPTVVAEKTRVGQIFRNLIDNAIKYLDKPEGHIEIGCTDDGDFWRFSVADNGPGIEKKYFQKIFQMFQTLVPRDERESTGIGLAIVKKIVELFGGGIWLESTLGQGTTFFFTLPKQEGVAPAEALVARETEAT
jgi:signal transduction histidine kinase/methyl-accepting chemotaxis protein